MNEMLADTTQGSEAGKTQSAWDEKKDLHRLSAHSHEQLTEEADDLKIAQGKSEYQLPQIRYKT